jgi:hypothetical protein
MFAQATTRNSTPASQRLLAPWTASDHSSLVTHHSKFLSTGRKLVEINPTPSQQRRKHFLFDTNERFFSGLYRIETAALLPLRSPQSPPPLSNRQSSQLKHSLTRRKHSPTLRPNRQKIQGSHASHDNIEVRLLLLDTPSGTVCTGFDQGCKDRARKPFLAVIQ